MYVSWDKSLHIIASGRSTETTTSGEFIINMPTTSESILGVGGAANRVPTNNGIALYDGEALYYSLPTKTNGSYKEGRFRIVNAVQDYTIDPSWVLLAVAYRS